MFQSKTGWGAVALAVLGALTAADVFPLVTEFLTATIGADSAKLIGSLVSIVATIVAKMSQPEPPTPPAAPPTP